MLGSNGAMPVALDIDLASSRDYMGKPGQRVIAIAGEVGIVRRLVRLRGTDRE